MEKQLDLRVCDGKYQLKRKIGSGAFGVVYLGLNSENSEEVAIKLQHYKMQSSSLRNEFQRYQCLSESGGVGFPRVHWLGREDEYTAMVFDLLGPSLENLFYYCNKRFSLKTVLMLFDQLIYRLEYLHSKKITHQDIKPANIVMGAGRRGNIVYVIDLGIAKERDYREKKLPRAEKLRTIGTPPFASVNGHYGQVHTRCDDLESLGYVMIYFLGGTLPWAHDQNDELILEHKESITTQDLCRGLPDEFVTYFHHIRTAEFNAKPKYSYLRRIFRNLFVREGYEYDNVFDWTVLKFLSNETR